MSNSSYKRWLEESIREGSIYCCPESDIKLDPSYIGKGTFGVVFKATVKQKNSIIPRAIWGGKQNILSGMTVAVKMLIPAKHDGNNEEDLYRSFVKELKHHQQVKDHPNVIRFLGLYKDKLDTYHMIFELAEGGTLYNYLREHFNNLTWSDKYNLGLGITSGLKYLHELKIVHKDLTSNNILIQSGIAKITDFGLSTVLKEIMSLSRGGTPAYRDPVCFRNLEYKRRKKSDIFSLGVILWEISSGKNPCGGRTESAAIIIYRMDGFRDPPVPGTSEEYVKLYSECWDEEPNNRPACEQVYERLINCSNTNTVNPP